MRHATKAALAAAASIVLHAPASATYVNWADLTSYDSESGTVKGSIDVGGTTVDVTITSADPAGIGFVQTGAGTDVNYWVERDPKPYTGGAVDNAPPGTDIIAFNIGSGKTITFSKPVSNVYLALVSWNGNSGTFDQPFDVVSQGCGFWGCGSFGDVTPTSFTGVGELHGVIAFNGTFTTTSFTDNSEYWHGIQIGISGIASPTAVPEPASWAMMIGGIGAAGGALRRRRSLGGATPRTA